MNPGPRTHKQSSLRVAVCEALPVEMWEQTRELISLQSENQRRGEASALMHQVCAEADRAWITLIVRPEPFGEGTTLEQLKRFYVKHGFEELQPEPCLMSRDPRKPVIARIAA